MESTIFPLGLLLFVRQQRLNSSGGLVSWGSGVDSWDPNYLTSGFSSAVMASVAGANSTTSSSVAVTSSSSALTAADVARGVVNVQNQSAPGELAIEHAVARESFFRVTTVASQLNTAAKTTILGRFEVKNNTIDGYSVSVSTARGGLLESNTTLDGEVSLPYTVLLKSSGSIGEGINAPPEKIESNQLANAKTGAGSDIAILASAGASVSSATDAKFELAIEMEGSAEALVMAGTYNDVITLTYRDI